MHPDFRSGDVLNRSSVLLAIAALAVSAAFIGAAFLPQEPSDQVSAEVSWDSGIERVSGCGTYHAGDTVTLTAYTKQYYTFDGWFSSDGSLLSSDPTYVFTAEGDVSLTCRSHTDHMVELTLLPDEGVESCTGGGSHLLGSEVTLTASVKDGYRFLGWYGPDGLIGDGDTLTVTASEMTVQVRTAEKGALAITLYGDEGIASCSGAGSYAEGARSVLSAELNPGYSFRGWYWPDGSRFTSKQTVEVRINGDTELVARTVHEYTVDVVYQPGLLVSGGGVFRNGAQAALSVREAVPGTFEGWYSPDGTCLSTQLDYVPEKRDALIIARSDTAVFSGTGSLTLGGYPPWYTDSSYCIVTEHYSDMVVDVFQGVVTDLPGVCSGSYDITFYNGLHDGSAENLTLNQDVGAGTVQRYEWTHDGEVCTMTIEPDRDEYRAKNSYFMISRAPLMFTLDFNATVLKYADPGSYAVRTLAEGLSAMTEGMSDVETVRFVLDFVQQCFNYQTDSDYNGRTEYWKFPAETLFERRGDCEDTSLLMASLLTAMGYDAAVLIFDGHMAAGVCLPGTYGTVFQGPDGVSYVYCETTAVGWELGQAPDAYDTVNLVVPV